MQAEVRRLDEGREIRAKRLRGGRTSSGANESYLSKGQVAEYYATSTTTIDNWCRAGMPFHRIGSRRKFLLSETDAWVGD